MDAYTSKQGQINLLAPIEEQTVFDQNNTNFDNTKHIIALCIMNSILILWSIMELSTSCALEYQPFLICFTIVSILMLVLMTWSKTITNFCGKYMCLTLSFGSWGIYLILFNGDPRDGFIAILMITFFSCIGVLYNMIMLLILFVQSCSCQ
jgi:hypothetical protein